MQPTPVVHDLDPDSHEPLLTTGSITATATALLAVLTTFGLDLTIKQQAAILGLLAVLAPIVVALWGRRQVYAPATVARLLMPHRTRPTRQSPAL